ncbi:MAG TPA: hypothetical protein VNL17_06860 [Verrucomicrobiae bacterium]|nr:hypothetical protein [Verrucomicrobiae bacterium]
MKIKGLVVPVLVIVLGVTWLLNILQVLPGVDWIWTVGLAAAGVLTLLVGGINKLTVVVGPFLMVGSICSLLRQLDVLPIDREIPILTIVLGILMLIAQMLSLPAPEILKTEDVQEKK